MGSTQDVPAKAADHHEFVAAAADAAKPIVFLFYSPRGAKLIFEMAAQITGGEDQLREKPFILFYPEPISPLVMPYEVAGRILVSADCWIVKMDEFHEIWAPAL